MNNLLKRIILAIIAIPFLICFIFFLPYYSHLAFNLLVAVVSILGGLEIRNFFLKKNITLNYLKTGIISAIFPVYSILVNVELIPNKLTMGLLTIALSFLLLREALMREQKLIATVLERLPAYCFILIFPGFFMSYIIRLSLLEHSSLLIIIFLTMVFSNDTFAYLTGMMFGSKNRGIFPVSPKKSLAGLLGGLTAAALSGYIFYRFHPYIFSNNPYFALITGVAIGMTSVIGDLIESALKRSANEKDSGTIMAGRGGVMDSIDSILFSAPLYFYLITMI